MRIGFVGAGKVGFTLGRYMTERDVHVSGYYCRNTESARQASEFTNTKHFTSLDDLVAESDALFLTVSDGAIGEVWNSIKHFSLKGKCICHCSGAMSSAVFSGIDRTGAFGYSIHPLFAINDRLQSYRDISKSYFTIEGSERYMDYWRQLFEGFGNPVKIINSDRKVRYHAAAVFASNLVVGLYEMATDILVDCGFDRDEASEAIRPLFINNAGNICSNGTINALTGPLERGDSGTMTRHLDTLNDEQREVYKALSREIVKVAQKKNPDRNYEEIIKIVKE